MIVVEGIDSSGISVSKLDPAVNELALTTRLRRVTAGAQVFHARLVDRRGKRPPVSVSVSASLC